MNDLAQHLLFMHNLQTGLAFFGRHEFIPRHFILINRKPVAVDFHTWAIWFASDERQIAETKTCGARVSTIFIGVNLSDYPLPINCFETMVFGGDFDLHQKRCSNYQEAKNQHWQIVDMLETQFENQFALTERTEHFIFYFLLVFIVAMIAGKFLFNL